MSDSYEGAGSVLGSLLGGIGGIKENEYNKDLKDYINRRGNLVRSLLAPMETPYLEGLAPSGFLREAMANEAAAKGIAEGEDMERAAAAYSTRFTTRGGALSGSAPEAEAFAYGYGGFDSGVKADSLIADNLLSKLGHMPVSPYHNAYAFAGDLAAFLGSLAGGPGDG